MVDALAKYGLSINEGVKIFDFVPSFLYGPIMADISRTLFPRGF